LKSLALFNNKGGVGKTTLTFNLAHMAARLDYRVAVLDYDPQCNLSSIFLDEDELSEVWEAEDAGDRTVAGCVEPVRRGKGAVRAPRLHKVADQLWILPGHLDLSRFEQPLAEEWPKTMSSGNERALDVTTSLDLLSNLAADSVQADLVFVDLGPSLGALNRSALLACDAIVLPLAPDLFSLQGMRNVGPTLEAWRADWQTVRTRHMNGREQQALPPHEFRPIGYIVQQHLARKDQAVKGYARWAQLIPETFLSEVLRETGEPPAQSVEDDPWCLALIRHFASLVPIAQQARKPMFDLKQSDGIGGGQIQAVARCRKEFEELVVKLVAKLGATKT
jgi:cellulose biosynthesis protein BcsQ